MTAFPMWVVGWTEVRRPDNFTIKKIELKRISHHIWEKFLFILQKIDKKKKQMVVARTIETAHYIIITIILLHIVEV